MVEPYSIRPVSEGRFAITDSQRSLPILGYVFKNLDDSWSVEHNGKVVPIVYDSLPIAARAVLVLTGLSHRSHGN
jgi:hypothetical protein